ncbi:MAG TPA: DUF309 domain-containing protein [Thermoanaerobaculia bacterium]|nr:DUF309 domain-containing protein [Thermoanaerobaculia bacterium]
METPIHQDPRFRAGVEAYNRGDFSEAGEVFEDLFFEAVRDEVEFVRVFLQLSTGAHHVERGQIRAAMERLEEALLAIDRVTDSRGWDFAALRRGIAAAIPQIEQRFRDRTGAIEWPHLDLRVR